MRGIETATRRVVVQAATSRDPTERCGSLPAHHVVPSGSRAADAVALHCCRLQATQSARVLAAVRLHLGRAEGRWGHSIPAGGLDPGPFGLDIQDLLRPESAIAVTARSSARDDLAFGTPCCAHALLIQYRQPLGPHSHGLLARPGRTERLENVCFFPAHSAGHQVEGGSSWIARRPPTT